MPVSFPCKETSRPGSAVRTELDRRYHSVLRTILKVMSTQRYSVTPHPIDTLLAWVKSNEVAIPEIQRPFVWDAVKVRNLLDSLYHGYPVGYLIVWRNPDVRLKDGSKAVGKRILIDGQQRVTALMAALLGQEVLDSEYRRIRVRIAFHPSEERFEVLNSAIQKDPSWIQDVADVFSPETSLYELTQRYCERNAVVDQGRVSRVLERLRRILNNHVGVIELDSGLDIDTVTEIFIRVNSAGAQLSQADFAMSKIAVNEKYGGGPLRKAIDYFCHAAKSPEFLDTVERTDPDFARTEYFRAMAWLRDANDDLYDPTYTDVLRVAFTTEFRRGELNQLVALLSGRNFETREYEEEVVERSFADLKRGVLSFMNRTHFERLTMILRSAGFITSDLITSANAVNFAYVVYLCGRKENLNAAVLERMVRRWYAMSVLRGRYTASPETAFAVDIRQISSQGLGRYLESVIATELPETFWTGMLPQQLNTSTARNPSFCCFQAAQVKLGDKGFLSRDITVRDLLLNRSDIHHVFPKKHLKQLGLKPGEYNQIANYAIAQSEINIAIRDKAPEVYFAELAEQVRGGPLRYGGIGDEEALRENLRAHCIPEEMLDGSVPTYEEFLDRRRQLMALKIKQWFETL